LKIFFVSLAIFFSVQLSFAQTNLKLVQLSGVVVATDSLIPVPFVNVYVQGTSRGTLSNWTGVFSLIVVAGDTVRFSALGFQTEKFVVDKAITQNMLSIKIEMKTDTVFIQKVTIYPWPSQEDFKQHFLALNVDDPLTDIAIENIQNALASDLVLYMPMDGNEMTDRLLRAYGKSFYSAGQMPYMGIFNAFAWAQFFKMLKENKKKKEAEKMWED